MRSQEGGLGATLLSADDQQRSKVLVKDGSKLKRF